MGNSSEKQMLNMEFIPVREEVKIESCTKVPFTRIAALGVAFVPVVSFFQSVFKGGKSGLYHANVPDGGHLAQFFDGRGYLGAVLSDTSNQVSGQATLTPVLDPTMLFMAAVLCGIDKKLDKIQETQQEILNYLVEKDRAELKGNLLFLSDVLNNYKYNWNNEKYKDSNYIKVLDIRQVSEQKIIFCKERILDKCNKKSIVHSDQEVKKQLKKFKSEFKDYRTALYLFAFSSFLEVMLLENYEGPFLNGIVEKIENYSFHYRELYTACYSQFEAYSKSSIQSRLLKGLSSVSSAVGKTLEKAPLINKSQLDETLIASGDKIDAFSAKRVDNTMQTLVGEQNVDVRPFIENIKTLNRLHNESTEILCDNENLYLKTVE